MELSIELRSGNQTRTAVKHVAQVTQEEVDSFIAVLSVDGWVAESWVTKDVAPYDEGFIAASLGEPENNNPYAAGYWKRDEWQKGWGFYFDD